MDVVVYTAGSQLRRPRELLRRMVHDARVSRELAWRLFVRNVSAQYRQSLLGYFWAFLPVLVSTLTWVFLQRQGLVSARVDGVSYSVFVLIGTLLWQTFADALMAPLRMVTTSRAMVAKVNLPHEALLLAAGGEVVFNFLVRIAVALPVLLALSAPLESTLVLVPVGVLVLILLGLTIGVLLTPLGVLYQDVQYALATLLGVWFLLTPVIYEAPVGGPAGLVMKLNPVSPLLASTRGWFVAGAASATSAFLLVAAGTLFAALLGWVFYRLAVPHLIARIGS